MEWIFWLIWGALGIVMLIYYGKRKSPVRSFLTGTLSGLLGLLLVHYGGMLVGYSPAINALHLVQSMLLGIPGVILMVVLHIAV